MLKASGLSDLAGLRTAVAGAGAWGPLVFAGLYGVTSLLPVPRTPMTLLGGVLFGPWVGTLAAFGGSVLGATLGYAAGRALGRDLVEAFGGERVQWVERRLGGGGGGGGGGETGGSRRSQGVAAVLALRMIPVSPFTAVNYAAGTLAVPVGVYAVGTVLGVIPGTVVWAAFGGWGF